MLLPRDQVAPCRPLLVLALAAFFVCAALQQPVYAVDLNNGADHRAHAVPGGPYVAYDDQGSQITSVVLDGSRSHSHYFNPATGVHGRIVSYTWTENSSRRVICRRVRCAVSMRLGRTVIRLEVADNTGDRSFATSVVTVRDGGKPGVRVLFYRGKVAVPYNLKAAPAADWSRTLPHIALYGPSAFPSASLQQPLAVRVLAELDILTVGWYKFRLDCGGALCMARVDKMTLLTLGTGMRTAPPFLLGARPYTLHILWRRPNPLAPVPRLVLLWRPPRAAGFGLLSPGVLSHRPALHRPVLHSVTPKQGTADTTITILGSGFVNVVAVYLGNGRCVNPVASSQYRITCEVYGGPGSRPVRVVTKSGSSNLLPFLVVSNGNAKDGIGYSQPIKFRRKFVTKDGVPWKLSAPSSIVLGPDGRYYIGVQWGVVFRVTMAGDKVSDACISPAVGKYRSVLGLAFNPAEGGRLRLYATTSILFWKDKFNLPMSVGWHNGEVIIMEPGAGCMVKTKTLITGLPVSNYDHGVNKLIFDNQGRMYITVGSNTNAGVPDVEIGNLPDSPLSGAILVAPINKKGFNGRIRYNQLENPGTARVVGGDVSLYSAGLRNSFGLVMHTNGNMYATDNGGNQAFGPRSTSCTTEAGRPEEVDKLIKVRKGGFHGSANRNRGRQDNKQCVHRTAGVDFVGYDAPMATLQAASTGLMEYTANTFGAAMRGDLLVTQLATLESNGRVYRAQLNAKGGLDKLYSVETFSGLAVAQMPYGGLLMPRVYRNQLVMLEAIERNPGFVVVTSVNPFRGPRRGGHAVTVYGWNLKPPLKVTFGGKPCASPRAFRDAGRAFTCTVPSGKGKVAVVVTSGGRLSRSAGFEYVYMNV